MQRRKLLICFDLAPIIEVECVIGLDYQLVPPVFFDVKGIPLVIVGEPPVLWMLRNVVFVTGEKVSRLPQLQNALCSSMTAISSPRHQFPAGLLIVQAIGVVVGTGFLRCCKGRLSLPSTSPISRGSIFLFRRGKGQSQLPARCPPHPVDGLELETGTADDD